MSAVMVKAVLDRIPDYRVDVNNVHQYLGNPSMTGFRRPARRLHRGKRAQRHCAPWVTPCVPIESRLRYG